MKTTYYIEGLSDNHLYTYFTRLRDAKYDLIKLFKPNHARIVCLKGSYRYEGYHAYYLTFDGLKFKKQRLI